MKNRLTKMVLVTAMGFTLMNMNGLTMIKAESTTKPSVVLDNNESAWYHLTGGLEVQLKSMLNAEVSDGTRLGAVVWVKNESARVTRVPDYEIRARTVDGIEYTLQPSAVNAKSVQPQSQVELSYMITIDHKNKLELKELSWIDVDWYVYPKKEVMVLDLSVDDKVWSSNDTVVNNTSAIYKWDEPFQLGAVNSPLIMTPVSIDNDYSNDSPVTVIKLLVSNNSSHREIVPEFNLGVSDGEESFIGERAEKGTITLEPNSKKYIHYAVTTKHDLKIKHINVLTLEEFVHIDPQGQPALVRYEVGQLTIMLPESTRNEFRLAKSYNIGDHIVFDSLNTLISDELDVALVEFSMHENEGAGYQTAIAKFKLSNTDNASVPVPVFETELKSADGYTYNGYRQNNAPGVLMPNMTHVVTYSYLVPLTETDEQLIMRVLDVETAAPYKSSIAAFKVDTQEPHRLPWDNLLTFYPYEMDITSWTVLPRVNLGGTEITYSYKLIMDVKVARDETVVVDQDFSTVLFVMEDSLGRPIVEERISFISNTATNKKLITGKNTIEFLNLRTDQHGYNPTIKIYEAIDTPAGEVRRLVKELKKKN